MKYQAYHTHTGNYIQHPNPHVYIHRHTYVCVVLSGNCCLLLRIALLAWCQTETASSAAPSAPTAHESMRQCGVSDCNASRWRQIFTNHSYLTHTQQQQQQQQKRQHTELLVLLSFQNWGRGEVATFSLEIHVSAWMRGVCMKLQSIYLSYHAHMFTRLCSVHTIIWICVCIFTDEYLLNRALLSNKTRASSLITLRKFEHRTGQPRQRNRTQSNSVLID